MGCGIMFPRDFIMDAEGEHFSYCFQSTASHHAQALIVCLFSVWGLADDTEDWDLEVLPNPSEVQNDLYAGNEDEEDEGEDLGGRKVKVGCSQNVGENKTKRL